MTLEQKERRKAVLRYAVSVPEWNLALKHRAAAVLTKCARLLMSVSQMMLATDAEDRFYPGRLWDVSDGICESHFGCRVQPRHSRFGAGNRSCFSRRVKRLPAYQLHPDRRVR